MSKAIMPMSKLPLSLFFFFSLLLDFGRIDLVIMTMFLLQCIWFPSLTNFILHVCYVCLMCLLYAMLRNCDSMNKPS